MWLYITILLGSILVPMVLSFDKKLKFYTQSKQLFTSIAIVAILYIAVDVYFTNIGVWGFNSKYHLSITFLGLPFEEWLFFILIPYASIFLHDSITLYFPKIELSDKVTKGILVVLILASITVAILNYDKAYTLYIFTTVFIVLLFAWFDKNRVLNSFLLTFLVILIPFIVVNAILTGSITEEPIVWYNNEENLNIRFLTIPIEDFGYAFSLILFNLLLRNKLKQLSNGN